MRFPERSHSRHGQLDALPSQPAALKTPASNDRVALRTGLDDDSAPTLQRGAPRSQRTTLLDGSIDGHEHDAPHHTLPGPGALIGGHYRVIGELGRGAMGVILLALDERLERKVAIKLIRAELLEPNFRVRFIHEAQAMARVNHPNVLYIHTFGEHESIPYFVMEFVEGKTLERWLEENPGPPDLDVALGILDEICQGVSAIHAAGTVHRDIKPSNILVDASLRTRIADLGVAAPYRGGAASNEVVGTPAYMAPEVPFAVGDRTPNPLADVYSLACVAYELLTGRLPFDVVGELAWILHHATAPVPPPSSLRPGLPRAFDHVLLQALAKKPEERTPSVELFRRALREAREESLEPVRIVIAEDDEDFREALGIKLRLEFPGADVECFGNGRSALEALERKPASVGIFDLQMPVLDGVALTAEVRARPSAAAMPIIVLTASGGPDEWRRLASLGADRFLVKPVHLDDVVTLIRHAIRERASIVPPAPSA